MVVKMAILETIYGGVLSCDNVKDFLDALARDSKSQTKLKSINSLSVSLTQDANTSIVSSYIVKVVQMANIQEKVNILMIHDFVVHCVLNSLSFEYEQLKVSYTARREEWNIDDLIYVCV